MLGTYEHIQTAIVLHCGYCSIQCVLLMSQMMFHTTYSGSSLSFWMLDLWRSNVKCSRMGWVLPWLQFQQFHEMRFFESSYRYLWICRVPRVMLFTSMYIANKTDDDQHYIIWLLSIFPKDWSVIHWRTDVKFYRCWVLMNTCRVR